MPLTMPSGARGAWLTVGRSAAGAVLVAVAVSACTGGGTPSPTVFPPTPQTKSSPGTQSGPHTPSPNGRFSPSPGSSTPAAPRTSASVSAPAAPRTSASVSAPALPPVTTILPTTPSATHASTRESPVYPTAAPRTGGGGTAGVQDGLLFGIGGVTVLAGLGSLAYRRRLARKLSSGRSARHPAAGREPADR